MNLFKMRVVNALLFLLIGLLMGLLIKSPPYRSRQPSGLPAVADYGRVKTSSSRRTPEDEYKTDPGEGPAASDSETYASPFEEDGPDDGGEIPPYSKETVVTIPPSRESGPQGIGDSFFTTPEAYRDSELEFELKLVNVKKNSGGWRFQLGYNTRGMGIMFLYLDADGSQGDFSGLQTGYFYKVRFKSRKGDLASGNSLVSITAVPGRE